MARQPLRETSRACEVQFLHVLRNADFRECPSASALALDLFHRLARLLSGLAAMRRSKEKFRINLATEQAIFDRRATLSNMPPVVSNSCTSILKVRALDARVA